MSADNREKRIQFHVDSHDYFATLASILAFVEESIEVETEAMGRSLKEMTHSASALRRINKDLIYLQQGFKIVKKEDIWAEKD